MIHSEHNKGTFTWENIGDNQFEPVELVEAEGTHLPTTTNQVEPHIEDVEYIEERPPIYLPKKQIQFVAQRIMLAALGVVVAVGVFNKLDPNSNLTISFVA